MNKPEFNEAIKKLAEDKSLSPAERLQKQIIFIQRHYEYNLAQEKLDSEAKLV